MPVGVKAAEVRALETRLMLDQSREGLLVELAAIGDDGVAALTTASIESSAGTMIVSVACVAMLAFTVRMTSLAAL